MTLSQLYDANRQKQAEQKSMSVIEEQTKATSVETYCSCFDFSHWACILKLVCDKSGPALAGHMSQYNIFNLQVWQT